MKPKLSILIPMLASRAQQSARLVQSLSGQVNHYDNVELLVEADAGQMTSGTKRARLLARATGEYVAFVDDDDLVATDYVDRLLDGCRAGADVITFLLEYVHGEKRDTWRFGLNTREGHRSPWGHRSMMANHLCAWKRWLAAAVPWLPINYADDVFWYRPLHASGLARNEHHVDAVLYHYQFNWDTTANQKRDRIDATKAWCGPGVDSFWLGDQIVVAVKNRNHNRGRHVIGVRTAAGEVIDAQVKQLRLITTTRV